MGLFGLTVPQVLGLFFVGYVLLNALSFFLTWVIQILCCGFHQLLSRLASPASSPTKVTEKADSVCTDLLLTNSSLNNESDSGSSVSDACCCDCALRSSCSRPGASASASICSDYKPDQDILSMADLLVSRR